MAAFSARDAEPMRKYSSKVISARHEHQQRGAHAERGRRDRRDAALGAEIEDALPLVENEEVEAVDVEVGALEEGLGVGGVDALLEAIQLSAPG